ncbi:PepSY domain-containing protein [Aquimarina sp. 433]
MTISIWRYSHLILAISSAVFLSIAAITGIILALEPISNAAQPYAIENIDTISIAEMVEVLQKEYEEVIDIVVEEANFVIASVVTKNGKNERIYIDPRTGEKLGVPENKAAIFKFATNLHRSLFLKSIGRFFVGLVSLLLVIIAITGVLLICKRQGGFTRFFSKVHKEYSNQFYHVVLGRWFLIPILIIAVTGVYLSLEKFSLLPKHSSSNQVPILEHTGDSAISIADFEIFKNIKLDEVRNIQFPFSDDIEDYFTLELMHKELIVNQFNGHVLVDQQYPFVKLVSYYSLILHTGKGNVLWSIVLLATSIVLLFFMYSGFYMTIQRRQTRKLIQNDTSKDSSEYIILVGSENGSTYIFADLLRNALTVLGKTVFVSELNAYATYKRAKHVIAITATYGEGEAPTNARKFSCLFKEIEPLQQLKFSVVGMGSLAYKDFCKYAEDIYDMLTLHPKFTTELPLQKINNKSTQDFKEWMKKWSNKEGILFDSKNYEEYNIPKYDSFKIVDKTEINKDNTFLLKLRATDPSITYKSGDLLAVIPNESVMERLYSIGKLDSDIILSVKKHERGVCSTYLSTLNIGDTLKARVQINTKFHLPERSKKVILIANGTGVAPFLGVIRNRNLRTDLFWGVRTKESLNMYNCFVGANIAQSDSTHIAYSKENEQQYVQDLIHEKRDVLIDVIKNEGVIMICGSLNMQKGVFELLETILEKHSEVTLDDLIDDQRLLVDCY